MTLFTIIKPFSPADGEKWNNYCQWRGMEFERFDSIDGILRPNLFEEPENEDWEHIVNENFMLHLITSLPHARHKHRQIGKGDMVGLKFEDHDTACGEFLGFDIIDGYCNVSLLTNFGNDLEFINRSLATNALLTNEDTTREIHRRLEKEFSDDSHVKGCRIVSIYKIDTSPLHF